MDSTHQDLNTITPISPVKSYYILAVFFLVAAFNFIDRQILTILLEPIKTELGVSDTWMGFLTGFAFAVFYVVAAIPIARLADRHNRRNIIAICVAVWSSMTVLTGFANSFVQLALTRIGVAVGEAGAQPSTTAIVADIFPLNKRATALAIVSSGAVVGILFGLFLGGLLNDLLGWRMAFIVVGIPGLIVALLVYFTVPEPVRGQADGALVEPSRHSFRQVLSYIIAKRTLVLLTIGVSFHALSSYAFMAWLPTFMIRTYEMTTTQVGLWLGLSLSAGLFMGNLSASVLADKMGTKDIRWYVWIPGYGNILTFPLAVLLLYVGTPFWTLIAIMPFTFMTSTWASPTMALFQAILPANMRASGNALLGFFQNLVGIGIGPLIVGILNDALNPTFGIDAIKYSLTIVSIGFVGSAVFYILSGYPLQSEYEKAAE